MVVITSMRPTGNRWTGTVATFTADVDGLSVAATLRRQPGDRFTVHVAGRTFGRADLFAITRAAVAAFHQSQE